MVYRIYVEKKPGFDGEAQGLYHELTELLGIQGLKSLRLLNRYDVEGIDRELFEKAIPTVFSEPPVDVTYDELPTAGTVFAVEYLPGQFDQRADSASQCIQLLSQGERPDVRSARVYLLEGDLSEADLAAIKKYVINPVEAREASLAERETLKMEFAIPSAVETLTGFIDKTKPRSSSSARSRGWPWTMPTSCSARNISAASTATRPSPRSRSLTPTGATTAATRRSARSWTT